MKEGFFLDKRNIIKNKNRNSIGISLVGFTLTTMAGWLDAVGLSLFLNQRSASMTGRGHILGYWAYKSDFKMFMTIVLIILAFITGAFLSTKIARKRGLTGSLFFSAGLIIMASIPFVLRHSILYAIFLPMAMGCQNAATSLTDIKRTTHLTGASTEIGINIAKGNWKVVRFWMYRWIGFPLGAFIGFSLADLVKMDIISISITLIVPAIIIILTGITQKKFIDIPLSVEFLEEDLDPTLEEIELTDSIINPRTEPVGMIETRSKKKQN